MHRPQDFRIHRKFSDKLEQQAWDVASRYSSDHHLSIASIARELKLVLQHIETLRELQDHIENSVGESRCSIKTKLSRIESQVPIYSSFAPPDGERFHSALLTLEAERRRNAATHHEQLRLLHSHLLSLLGKHAYLMRKNGISETT